MEKIVIVGGGSFLGNLINYIESMGKYEIVGYTDIENHGQIFSVCYLGNDSILPELFSQGVKNACMALGNYLNNSSLRTKVTELLKDIGYNLPAIIGHNVIIHKGVKLEEGCIIRDAAIIQSNCTIGCFAIIGDNVVVSHDTVVGDYSQIVTGSIIGRGCRIGNSVFIGFNAVLTNDLVIVDECIIGAKSLVNKSCLIKGKYIGIPAKIK